MSSHTSDENKSSSMTSESENIMMRKKFKEFTYPSMPQKNPELRNIYQRIKNEISTNLFEIKFRNNNFRFTLFNITILPEIAEDNYPLIRLLHSKIDIYLPECFKLKIWAGKNMYAIMEGKEGEKYEIFEVKVDENNIQYKLKFEKIKEISFKKAEDFNGKNQKNKSIIENIFRNILMKNPKVIKFHDRTIFEIDPDNIIHIQNKQNFYSGYITSANITESGLYMLVNNINKLITGKTVLKKMIEIRNKLKEQNMQDKEIYREIKEYFKYHRTVLTTYGSLRTYKILDIDFDKNPSNTNINYKDMSGLKRTISLINYYKLQYQLDIKEKNQPLIIAENKALNGKKLLTNDKNSQNQNYDIYLIPELVYITGLEETNIGSRHRNIISSGIRNPNDKMKKIKSIYNLINSNNSKIITNKKKEKVSLKSPKELSEQWGINLGCNLTFQGNFIPQPHLYFKGNEGSKEIIPENGRYRSGNPYKSFTITNTNIFFVYDKYDGKINHRKLFIDLMYIFKEKMFHFSNDFNPNEVKEYVIENSYNWENIKRSLPKFGNDERKLGIIFTSSRLERFYNQLKSYFVKQLKITTQHIITRKITDGKKAKSIMYNIVDQINIKLGGENFYIDFKKENIIKSGQVFLIIGLDSKRSNGFITFSMTSSKNFKLNVSFTQEYTCEDKILPKNLTLMKMFREAIEQIDKFAPHCPDFIIIYRQGGNDVQNKWLAVNEVDNFKEVINEYRKKNKDEAPSNNYTNTKLYYICCNLKSDLKFFETNNNINNPNYQNPKSGLVVDEKVTQSNKFEFYLQPQYVNQGSATPCHYQVMYYDKSENEENELKLENLEKLSFYLSYYYWTWGGAIRVPYSLKMSTTAMDFFRKIYDDMDYYFFEEMVYM